MIVTSYSDFSFREFPTRRRASVISRKARWSLTIVSDDLTWSSSNLIIRLYFLLSVGHKHRCERFFSQKYEEGAQLLVHLQSLEACTFEPLLSQVLADWPTNEPLPVPVHQVSSQLCTTALPFLSLEESKYLHSRLVHHCFVAGHTCDSVEPNDIDESLPRGSTTMHDTSMNTAMSERIDQMTICSMSVLRSRNDSPAIPRPLHNSATKRLTTLPIELINDQRDMSEAGNKKAKNALP